MLPEVLAAAALDLGDGLGADAPCAGRVLPVRVGEVVLVEGDEVVQGVSGVQVVGRVGLFPVDGGSDDAHGRRAAVEVPPDPPGVREAGSVVVGDDHDVRAGQGGGVLLGPPAFGPVGDAGRGRARRGHGVGVLFALDEVDGPAVADGGEDLGQAVE